mgnify:CR=1 FL=1
MCIRDRDEAVKENIAGYFNDPSGFGVGNGPSAIEGKGKQSMIPAPPVSYTHLRAHETVLDLVCRLLLEKKKQQTQKKKTKKKKNTK